MARNQEKAQSMLYRFRQAQAASLGVSSSSTHSLRRPRLASSVTSLKECERWRTDVIREISRKVSKIQDFGLTDYEVRDLNDEINRLLREKRHWETRILELGGANYKRAVPSMVDEGMGRKGAGGYKYFGRAKDLPGVKELFATQHREEREERYERFNHLPPSYYGDEDEDDGVLLEEEGRGEEEEWQQRFVQVVLGLKSDRAESSEDEQVSNEDIQVPSIPRSQPKPWKEELQAFTQSFTSAYTQPDLTQSSTESTAKRPSTDDDDAHANVKRQKLESSHTVAASLETPSMGYSIFTAQDLQSPAVPDRAAMEQCILHAKKRQLRQQYIGT